MAIDPLYGGCITVNLLEDYGSITERLGRAPASTPVRTLGRLNAQVIDRNLIAVAADEDADTTDAQFVVRARAHLGAVDQQRQALTNRAHRELVRRVWRRPHRGRALPGQQVDPMVIVAAP